MIEKAEVKAKGSELNLNLGLNLRRDGAS